MSWSFNHSCDTCGRRETCPDRVLLQGAIHASHSNFEHVQKGGAGSVHVSCVKHEPKKEA